MIDQIRFSKYINLFIGEKIKTTTKGGSWVSRTLGGLSKALTSMTGNSPF